MNEETNNQNLSQDPSTENTQQVPSNLEQTPTNQQTPANLLMNQAYIESERERIRLMQENETLKASRHQPAQNYDNANQEFFNKPAESMAQLIEYEVNKTISPIANEFRQFTRSQAYQTLKSQYRQIPNFNLIENTVDQIMANLDPTAANMNGAISMAVGQLTLQGHAFNQVPLANKAPITPPNLPPSPPSAPVVGNAANKIVLTEMQKRVARENYMTDDQYIAYLTADAKEVLSVEKK